MFVQSSALTDSKESTASPSAEALGYFLSVRFADEEKILLRQSRAHQPRTFQKGHADVACGAPLFPLNGHRTIAGYAYFLFDFRLELA